MTNIKICGLQSLDDVAIVNEVLPEYVGFVFAPGRHQINTTLARQMRKALDPRIQVVGVFVSEPIDRIVALCEENLIDLIQLHGEESLEECRELKQRVSVPVIYAIRMKSEGKKTFISTRDRLDRRETEHDGIDFFLFDTYVDGLYGGSGKLLPYEQVPQLEKPYFVAGGLTALNVSDVIKHTNPYAVDVSSGVETNGKKDRDKIIAFVTQVRGTKNEIREVGCSMKKGRFQEYGGQYVPETLMNAVIEVEEAYEHYKTDESFQAELNELLRQYAGRPSRLYYAQKMTKDLGGAKIYLKREDLNHTGSHKLNNVLGQVLLAKKIGKTRVIAETGAGQHGVATATAAALMGLECEIFMGEEDTKRQALNVFRMELLGAKVHPVTSGTKTLKDAVNETMREWTRRVDDTWYVLGSVMGPHPFPTIVRDFQKIIGEEIREQLMEVEGKLPDAVIACVGGGSNAIGAFHEFIKDETVQLIGCEAAGLGVDTAQNAATIANGSVGIFHGMKSIFCQDEYGQIAPVYSISAGLDYPGIGPEHAMLHDIGRATYVPITDEEAVDAFEYLSRTEGIIPAIESSHAVAYAKKIAGTMSKDQIIVINISGRGDKDVAAIARYKGVSLYE